MGHTAGRFVGREAPLAQLGDAVARARDGVRTTVLIEADAGIGKSRLVADGLRTFRDRRRTRTRRCSSFATASVSLSPRWPPRAATSTRREQSSCPWSRCRASRRTRTCGRSWRPPPVSRESGRTRTKADLARAERADSPETWTAVRDAWRDLEHVPFHAWAALRLAEVQHAADARESAGEALAEAWTLARPLGAQPLTDAITGLARRARLRVDTGGEHAGRAATGRLARLTRRELEVLRHLARGDSNDEVAAALFISPKTASVHVSRILAKLDVTNRSKAAAVAFEEGLDLQTP